MERYRVTKVVTLTDDDKREDFRIKDMAYDVIVTDENAIDMVFPTYEAAFTKASHLNIGNEINWLTTTNAWSIINGLGNAAYKFYYRAMHDNGMDLYDADDYAWLNTLLGYDIGADHAKGICRWLYENDETVTSYCAENLGTLKSICELELGYHLDFSNAVTETPEAIQYAWSSGRE